MTRASPVVWFAAAFCAFAPALLDADIQRDGTALRPLQRSFRRGGLRVTLDVDRAIAITGSTATATITARSKVPEDVTLDLRVVATKLEPGARTPGPSSEIETEQVHVHATPEGTTVTEPIQLDEKDPQPGRLERFTIYVAPAARTPRGDDGSDDNDDSNGGDDGGDREGREAFASAEAAVRRNRAAAIDVMGWSGDRTPMAITADGPIVLGRPFRIAIRVTTDATDATEPSLSFTSGIAEVAQIGATRITPADGGSTIPAGPLDSRPEQDPSMPVTFRTLDREIVADGSDGTTFVEHMLVTPDRPLADIAFSVYAQLTPGIGGDIDAYDVVAFHATEPAQTAAR